MRMLRISGAAVVLTLACAVAGVPFGAANAAKRAPATPASPCAVPFYVTADDSRIAVVRVIDLAGPFTGTITAYGGDRMSTGKLERSALVNLPYGGSETTVTVRSDRPIEGIEYAPDWAACTFRAGVVGHGFYEAFDVERPVVTVTNPHAAEPTTCGQPYGPPSVKRAEDAIAPPGPYYAGVVRVAVALDERGIVRYTRVVQSPSEDLNSPTTEAASRSEYSPAVFRCKPVPGGYQFVVDYSP